MADSSSENRMFSKKLTAFLALPLNVMVVIPLLLYFFLGKIPITTANFISAVLIFIGLGLLVFGSQLLHKTIQLFSSKGKGTLAPWSPTQKLVIEGPYQYSRNPMITAVVSNLIGIAFVTNHLPILCWALLFFSVNHIYFILSEEPSLRKKFGKEYENYFITTPRWIPKKRSSE